MNGITYTDISLLVLATLFLSQLVSGEIDLRIDAPQRIRLNDGVTLTCSMDYTHSKLIKPRDTCTLWWTKPGENPPWKVLSDHEDEGISISVEHGRGGRPTRSTLTIARMRHERQGRYSCHVWCGKVMESVTVSISLAPATLDAILGDEASVIGAIVTILSIFIICVASCCCVAKEFCKRQRRHSNGHSNRHNSEGANLFDSYSGSSASLSNPDDDLPPRYSVVVVSSAGQPDQSVAITPSSASVQGSPVSTTTSVHSSSSHVLNAIAAQENITGVFVIPSPPPNYRQALLDLAEKGVIFNPESLKPPPPSYDELMEEIDLNSSNCSQQNL